MPARYRPGSEYKKKFRWHESVKSASFTPAPEQKAPKAGLASGDMGYVRSEFREPALQRRGKPLPGQVTHTIKQVNSVPSDTDSDNIGKTRQTLASAKTYKIPQHHTAADKISNGRKPGICTNGEAKSSREPTAHTNGEANEPVTSRLRDAPDIGVTRGVSTQRKERHESGDRSSDINRNNNRTINKKAKTSRSGVDVTAARSGSSGDRAQPNIALQYQAGIHPNRPKGAKYLSEYQRQFEWKKPLPKESPLIAAEQMVYNSNTNIAPYVPDKIPRHTEYQKQFKAWQPIQPTPQEQLVENAQREIKAKYMVKTKSKKSKKTNTTPDRMRAAGVPSVTSHENIQQLKASQNPQQPFFPHSTIRKWKSEYRSNFKAPHKFSYEDGVWKGAGPPHIQPKDDTHSDNGRRETAAVASPLRRTKSQHDLPNWFAEVLELRKKAQEYQQRARGTHFSREHMAQLIARQAQMWDASSTTASSTTSSLSAPSVEANRPEDARIPTRDIHPTTSTAEPVSRPGPTQDNNNNVSPARRKLAWPEDSPADRPGDRLGHRPSDRPSDRLVGRPGNRPSGRPGNRPSPRNNGDQESSIGSIPTPEGYRGSVSASSDDFEIIESNGRPPTPQLREKGIEQRHHLNRTTPAVGGAILTSPKPVRKQPPHSMAPGRTYVAKSAPPRTQVIDGPRGPTILPGGTDRGFDWFTSDEDDPPTPRTQTPPPPPPAQQTRILHKVQGSPPAAGISTRDPHQLNPKLRSPTFQRHSKNVYETGPAMPEMPRGIGNPPAAPQTWAAPRDTGYIRPRGQGSIGDLAESDSDDENIEGRIGVEDELRRMRTMPVVRDEVRREELDRPHPATMHVARQGPLDRPNSGSMHGRPMTAHPQTRQAASNTGIPSIPMRNDPIGNNPSHVENGQVRPTAKTWTVPREANVNVHNGEGDLLSTPRGSISDRLSMSGISSVSSSSLASEVLERARKRRDDFWGMP